MFLSAVVGAEHLRELEDRFGGSRASWFLGLLAVVVVLLVAIGGLSLIASLVGFLYPAYATFKVRSGWQASRRRCCGRSQARGEMGLSRIVAGRPTWGRPWKFHALFRGAVDVRYTVISSFAWAAWRSVRPRLGPSYVSFCPRKGRRPAWPVAADCDAIVAKLSPTVLLSTE